MVKCGMFHNDLVIVQSVVNGRRFFVPCHIFYVSTVPNTQIHCSKDVFRVISPSFTPLQVTVFKMSPGSSIMDANTCSVAICPRDSSQRTMDTTELFPYIKMKLTNLFAMKNQTLIFTMQGLYFEVIIQEISSLETLPAAFPNAPPAISLYRFTPATLFQMHYYSSYTAIPSLSPSSPLDSNIDSSAEIVSIPSSSEDFLSSVSLQRVGGLSQQKKSIIELMNPVLKRSEKLSVFSIRPSRGILLYGPPGTGKTLLVREICEEYHIPVFSLHVADVLSKYAGESEQILRDLFKKALLAVPAVIFLDEVDALCPSRGSSSQYSNKMTLLLVTLLDSIPSISPLFLFGATNRPQSLDVSLRRPGRFDKEIEIGVPANEDKREILKIHMSKVPNSLTDENYIYLSTHTNGYVGADLKLLCQEAALKALNRHILQGPQDHFCVNSEDIYSSLSLIRASALREITVNIPHVHWEDVGGNEDIKQQLREIIDWPFIYAQQMNEMNIQPPRGILLFGPPGCSKTLFAKVVATESNMNFISIKGPELFSKYVGESEQAVMNVFKKARAAAPCVLFFDEIDALATSRGGDSGVTERVISQLLQEMDGIHTLKHVLVIGATNRPDILDTALLRPGRFDTHIYCPLPGESTRLEILKVHTRNIPISDQVHLEELANKTEGYSGAELAALCREAAICCLSHDMENTIVEPEHFMEALENIVPRTSSELIEIYREFIERE
ncbi:hypothetical protein WA158_007401 [Blastocystis sp. Blastoise]